MLLVATGPFPFRQTTARLYVPLTDNQQQNRQKTVYTNTQHHCVGIRPIWPLYLSVSGSHPSFSVVSTHCDAVCGIAARHELYKTTTNDVWHYRFPLLNRFPFYSL